MATFAPERKAEVVDAVLTERMTVPKAAAAFGISESAVYAWVSKAKAAGGGAKTLRRAPPKTRTRPVGFVRLARSGEMAASLEIEVGGIRLTVRRGFDPELLREVTAALRVER